MIIDSVEEAIGVLESPEYLEREARLGLAASQSIEDLARALQRVLYLCSHFAVVARQLQQRHDRRPTITINDEYDVQDLFHALLRLDFNDVRCEEPTPSSAGKSARIDFLLKREKIVVEIKKTRPSLGAREVDDQLLIDIGRYKAHPDCHALVCFVYDPEFRIGNPVELASDLTKYHDGLDVRVVVHPAST
jgi:REase_DpnII-MboI